MRGFINLLNGSALVHCIQNLLRTTFCSHPGCFATGTRKISDIIFLQQKICANLDLKSKLKILGFNKVGEFLYPSRLQSKYVVAKPDMIEIEFVFHQFQFIEHILWGP